MPAVKLSQILQNQTNIAAIVSGSTPAAKATKFNTARSINGISFDGSANINHYATCATAAATAAKTATLSGYSLQTGGRAMIKFTYENTAAAPTMNINSTGAKLIKAFGTTESTVQWVAGDVVELIYDGTNYIMLPTMGMVKDMDDAVDAIITSLNGEITRLTNKFVTITGTSISGEVKVADYPAGFTISNSVIVSLMVLNATNNWYFVTTTNTFASYKSDGIYIYTTELYSASRQFRIVLMRTDI